MFSKILVQRQLSISFRRTIKLSKTSFCATNIALLSSLVRKPVPEFTNKKALINGEISSLSSTDLRGHYWILLFYPLDFTFVCPTELIAFNDRIAEFEALGAKVVAASVDSEYAHLAWTKLPRSEGGLGPMHIPMIADVDKSLSSKFKVLLDSGIALRGLFIIDREGIIRQSTINDLPIGRSVDETIRLLEAIQFADTHGEVCPAGWKPGNPTIVPTPEGAKKYFSAK